MMNQGEKPRIPEVGEYVRGCGKLVEIKDVTPPVKEVTGYIFESLQATVQLWLNGRHVEDFGTFNDFYGLETCLKTAIEEAGKLQEKYGPAAEFKIVKHTYYSCSGLLHPEQETNFYDRKYRGFRKMTDGYDYSKVPENKTELYWTSTGGLVEDEETLPPNDETE